MSEPLFDKSLEYDEMLHQGLAVTGENKRYYMEGRVWDMVRNLPDGFSPRRILDYGCGTGETCEFLSEVFPGAEVTGTDLAENALEHARKKYGSARIHFLNLEAGLPENVFDLCYVNGVFHHIQESLQVSAMNPIYHSLKPGGFFALFENNPWNPGTHMVMSKIAFDRDAKMVSAPAAAGLLKAAGFQVKKSARFLFYFPKQLSFLRFIEPALVHFPLGGQYWVMGEKA